MTSIRRLHVYPAGAHLVRGQPENIPVERAPPGDAFSTKMAREYLHKHADPAMECASEDHKYKLPMLLVALEGKEGFNTIMPEGTESWMQNAHLVGLVYMAWSEWSDFLALVTHNRMQTGEYYSPEIVNPGYTVIENGFTIFFDFENDARDLGLNLKEDPAYRNIGARTDKTSVRPI